MNTDSYALASLILDYPDEAFFSALPELKRAVPACGKHCRWLDAYLTWAECAGLEEVRAAYTDTFDLRRTTTLDLTFYEFGDTRERGQALLELRQRYRAAGVDPDPAQLPDYLPALLGFAATTEPQHGESALRANRVGLEMLKKGLLARNSPWAPVVAGVAGLLGPMSAEEAERAAKLRENGPPKDLVGIGAFEAATGCPAFEVGGVPKRNPYPQAA
jgi:nitrate reductase delta subunit